MARRRGKGSGLGYGLGGVFGLVLCLGAVVLVRTFWGGEPGGQRPLGQKLPPASKVNIDAAALHLSEAIQIKTVSHQDPAEDDPASFVALQAYVQKTYPAFHRLAQREVIGGGALLYTWQGSDPSLAPMILMAHQDVVPVAEDTLAKWSVEPFSGTIKDGAIWGRGALDDKGSLIALFEAFETLAAKGFTPRRTVILVSGHNEEVSGTGAKAVAEALKARGIKAEFVLDEGSALIPDLPVLKGPAALIGVAEKGYATMRVTAKAPGGHSSAPPKDTAVSALSRAILTLQEHQDPLKFQGPLADMLKSLSPNLPFVPKMAVRNDWLFGPILVDQIAASPEGAASLHTTMAPTMLTGSPKENVLPTEASALVNYRLRPGQGSDQVMAAARAAIKDKSVSLSWDSLPREASPVSSSQTDSYRLIAALASDQGQAPSAPSLVIGGTDSRNLIPVSKAVYRYTPMSMSLKEVGMVHGINERMTLKNLSQMIGFYERLIIASAG